MGNAQKKPEHQKWEVNIPVTGSYLLTGFKALKSTFDGVERLCNTLSESDSIIVEFSLGATCPKAEMIMFQGLRDISRLNPSCRLSVVWNHLSEDEDSIELGKMLAEVVDIPFEFRTVGDIDIL